MKKRNPRSKPSLPKQKSSRGQEDFGISRTPQTVPEALVSHAIRGRLRIKIPLKKGDESYFADLSDRLSNCPGVEAVTTNLYTGGVLVVHDCEAENIAGFARHEGLFSLKRATGRRRSLLQEVARTFQQYNRSLKKMTGGELDISSLIFLSLVVSGLWQIARGNLTIPAWYTAFYYALGVYSGAQVEAFDEGENLAVEMDDLGAGE
ncbi:MAG: HMA2 domain-containing protein [Thermodesulfobacteriota bacterium]